VPDEALARVYDVVPQEVARRRAAAIERLADELGAQRGEDLGAVLQALLDEGTWTASPEVDSEGNGDALPDSEAVIDIGSAGGPVDTEPDGAQDAGPSGDAEPAAEKPKPAAGQEPEAGRDEPAVSVDDESQSEPEPEPEAEAPVVPVSPEPVLEMLAAREGVRGPGADEPEDGDSGQRRGVVAIAVASFVAAVIGGAAAFVGLSQWDDSAHGADNGGSKPPSEGMKHFVPQLGGPFEAPFPSDPEPLT
jgi:hypothetical protein